MNLLVVEIKKCSKLHIINNYVTHDNLNRINTVTDTDKL